MNLAHNKEILIFLLTSLGLIVFPHVFHLHFAVFGFFCFLLIWRFYGIWRPERLPSFPWIVFLIVLGMAVIYIQHRGILGRDGGTSLFVVALGLKLMEIKSERDLYLINYLAFIVAASQFLFGQSILMAAYILLVCCVLLAVLVYINSYQANTRVSVKKAATIVGQAIPMMIAVFILFPRVEPPKWLFYNDPHQKKTGLSDTMEPGSISDLGMSDELVFRVKFEGDIPPNRLRYWRGPVLTLTDGKKWRRATDLSYARYRDKTAFTGKAYNYTLLMEPQQRDWVFALDLPAQFAHPLEQKADYQMTTAGDLRKRSEYRLTSHTTYNTGRLTQIEYRDALQLPGQPSARIKQLVTQLHGFDKPPADFIQQLLNHFRQEDFHYTLTPPLLENNPIESFLFDTRRGFCSHYASAFVYLMRTAGIPARVVTGYQGGTINDLGNFLEIKQADAHAWTEVWLPKQGWVRIDPTAAVAPERVEQNIDFGNLQPNSDIRYVAPDSSGLAKLNLWKQASKLWGHLDYNWQRWVINYNNANQSSFLEKFGIRDFKSMALWLFGATSLCTALLSLILLYQKPRQVDPALKQYQRFLKKLARVGIVRQPGEGPKDFAERIKPLLPEQARQIEEITRIFIDVRYGRDVDNIDMERLTDNVRIFKV